MFILKPFRHLLVMEIQYIEEDDIPTETSRYNIYNLNITNDNIIPGYEFYVYDDVINYNYDRLIQNNGNITIFHREPFIANVNIKMDSRNPGYQIDSIKVSSDPIFGGHNYVCSTF